MEVKISLSFCKTFDFECGEILLYTNLCVISTVDIELIELTRNEGSPLGIQIRSSRSRPGIYVYYLVPGSVADDSKMIHPGDCILEANGHDLRQASVDDAANYMSVSEILNYTVMALISYVACADKIGMIHAYGYTKINKTAVQQKCQELNLVHDI